MHGVENRRELFFVPAGIAQNQLGKSFAVGFDDVVFIVVVRRDFDGIVFAADLSDRARQQNEMKPLRIERLIHIVRIIAGNAGVAVGERRRVRRHIDKIGTVNRWVIRLKTK